MSPMSNETAQRTTPGGAPPEASLLDFAAVLLRRWKIVVVSTLLVTAAAAAYALLQPRTYTSRLVLVPSASSGGDSRAQALLSQMPALAGRLPMLAGGAGPSQALIEAILRSNALRDSVKRRLRAGPGAPTPRDLGEILSRGTTVESDPANRSITVDVVATDPRLAARVAGEFPEAVNRIATEIAVQTAEHKRETLERQLTAARERLQQSEQQLLAFQERVGAPEIQEQARQTVQAGAELQRQVSEAEVRVARLARSSTPDNPDYRAALSDLETLRAQLRRLTQRGSEVFLSKEQIPGVRLQMGRLLREFNKNEQIYLSLTAELSSAQMDAAEDLAVVSVLDAPAVPDRPSGPRVKLLLVLGVMLGGVLGLFLAYVKDFLVSARQAAPDEPFFVEWDRLRGHFGGDRAAAGNGRGARVG